jgi:FkbM family methyltransferase
MRHVSSGASEFDFWITNADADAWYPAAGWRDLAPAELLSLQTLVRRGDAVLEIGSHHGFTGLLLATLVGTSGRVLGVEARPSNVIVAQANANLNRCHAGVTFIHALASDSLQSRCVSSDHNGCVVTTDAWGAVHVPTITCDELDQMHGPFDVVKVDVEGFEQKVLSGGRGVLARRPRLAIELHLDSLARYDSSVEEIFALIHIDDYRGVMYQRPDYVNVTEFDRAHLPSSGIVNLFLEPTPGQSIHRLARS